MGGSTPLSTYILFLWIHLLFWKSCLFFSLVHCVLLLSPSPFYAVLFHTASFKLFFCFISLPLSPAPVSVFSQSPLIFSQSAFCFLPWFAVLLPPSPPLVFDFPSLFINLVFCTTLNTASFIVQCSQPPLVQSTFCWCGFSSGLKHSWPLHAGTRDQSLM